MLTHLDVLVAAKLSATPDAFLSNAQLAQTLAVSTSAVHISIGRCQNAGLLSQALRPFPRAIAEMLAFGVEYFIPAHLGAEAGGMATSFGVSPLREIFGERNDAPVWPSTLGEHRGSSVEPIYKTVPFAASRDRNLYRLLALVDAIRVGRARESTLARAEIAKIFGVGEW